MYNHVMNKTDLLPGDILLLVDEPTNTTTTHKLIKTGQKMVPGLQGASELVHAVIWVRDPTNAEPWEIAEASGSGRVRVTSLRSTSRSRMLVNVDRLCANPRCRSAIVAGAEVASSARMWASPCERPCSRRFAR